MSEIHRLDRLEEIPDPVPDGTFVVVDVIISSTSIVRLLEAGATYVRPFDDPERALAFKAETEDAVLVGEDGGRAIEGFDLSPLPSIIESATLDARPVGIRTSNGTRAMDRIGHDRRILVGSTVNAAAIAGHLREVEGPVWIVAAGRQGQPIAEDVAGAKLVERELVDSVDWPDDRLRADIRDSVTAEWLRDLGYENELEALLDFNSTETVPRLVDGVFVAD